MNELQIFNNSEFGEIRTVELNNEPWFVGKDVAQALGYSDTRKAVAMHVDEDDKTNCPITDSIGREQDTTIINESGVYALVFGSKLESAKKFKHWITSEVLPQIRKTGAYGPKSQLEVLQIAINNLVEQERQMKELSNRVDMIEAKTVTSPVDYYTIAGFASLRKSRIDVSLANLLGRKAAKISREYGYDVGKVSDPRYGTINTYHVDILTKLFDEV